MYFSRHLCSFWLFTPKVDEVFSIGLHSYANSFKVLQMTDLDLAHRDHTLAHLSPSLLSSLSFSLSLPFILCNWDIAVHCLSMRACVWSLDLHLKSSLLRFSRPNLLVAASIYLIIFFMVDCITLHVIAKVCSSSVQAGSKWFLYRF